MVKEKKERLSPIPRRKRPRAEAGGMPEQGHPAPDTPAAAGLSFIAEDLRPLARPISSLEFHPKNPRTHGEEQISRLAALLTLNGQYRPLLASTRTQPATVVCGNGTLRAALSLGWAHIAAVLRPLTEAQENQIAIADNAVTLESEWDDALLAEMLKDVDTGNLAEVDALLADLAKKEGLFKTDEDKQDAEDDKDGYKEQYAVIVHCENEAEQKALFDRFQGEGLKVKVVTT